MVTTVEPYEFNGMVIPARMMKPLRDFVEKGRLPGDFLQAVISNDLTEAVARADSENVRLLPAYVGFLYNQAPGGCWGSRDRMMAWVEKHMPEEVS